jgi:hypothetical protein
MDMTKTNDNMDAPIATFECTTANNSMDEALQECEIKFAEITEAHEKLRAAAMKAEFSFKGCFTEYVGTVIKLERCASGIQNCDAAFTEVSAERDMLREQLKEANGWLGIPGWGWALIGVGAGAVSATVLIVSVQN